uniref:Uncharacterized protein n=1 Tax=Tanacetum cinerariifolium TaxID=118510 RepID=A0A699Q3M8_TANCI|nr:hypothetical protein [Tanacetum cinerariifolium]
MLIHLHHQDLFIHGLLGFYGVGRPISVGGRPIIYHVPFCYCDFIYPCYESFSSSRADLHPPRKRFRDSISPGDSIEEDIHTDVLEDIEANATAIEVVVDRYMEVGLDVTARIDILDVMYMPDAVERLEQVEEGLKDIYDHVIEIPRDTSSKDRGH